MLNYDTGELLEEVSEGKCGRLIQEGVVGGGFRREVYIRVSVVVGCFKWKVTEVISGKRWPY